MKMFPDLEEKKYKIFMGFPEALSPRGNKWKYLYIYPIPAFGGSIGELKIQEK